MRQRLTSDKGFTLIELVVVMAILLILAALVIPSYLGFADRANKSAVGADLRAAIPSVEAWHLEHGTYAGMTVAALKASYDQSLNASIVSLGALSGTTYCVMAKSPNESTKTAAKAGPSAPITIGATCP